MSDPSPITEAVSVPSSDYEAGYRAGIERAASAVLSAPLPALTAPVTWPLQRHIVAGYLREIIQDWGKQQ